MQIILYVCQITNLLLYFFITYCILYVVIQGDLYENKTRYLFLDFLNHEFLGSKVMCLLLLKIWWINESDGLVGLFCLINYKFAMNKTCFAIPCCRRVRKHKVKCKLRSNRKVYNLLFLSMWSKYLKKWNDQKKYWIF